jgi:hypothetical protein
MKLYCKAPNHEHARKSHAKSHLAHHLALPVMALDMVLVIRNQLHSLLHSPDLSM